jgi:aryl-alcohol dehydrogenase-like predicted oxidoreductase
MIGSYLKFNPNFIVSTKTLYTKKTKQPLEVRKNFQISLEKLKTQSVDCLFFHSTPPEMMCEADINDINYLKKSGLIKKIGYSGDNFKLNDFKIEPQFDCLMITFNALDISDQPLIRQAKNEVYIKRPMANFIFNYDFIKEIKYSIKRLMKTKYLTDTQSYQFRFEKMQGRKKLFTKNFEFYIRFITSFHPTSNYVFGVSSIKHLDEIVRVIRILNYELTEDLIVYYNRLQELTKEYNWKSLQ